MTLATKFHKLEDELNSEIFERTEEIHTAVLAILSRKHHFQIGPPGTAKSLGVDRLSKRIGGLGEHGYFRWLLTNFTTPEELYGGPDFNLLREGTYKRVTDRKLPKAKIAFLDEIFKGSSSILNFNLTAMNERLFFNADDDPNIPLITLFAASNELPQSEGMSALWDRLHFRHEIGPMQESSSFIRMLSQTMNPDPAAVVDLSEIHEAHALVDAVQVPADIFEAMKQLRADLRSEEVTVTERRWVESVSIIKAEAFLNGNDTAEIADMRPLMHVLWSELDHQKTVRRRVLELANPIDKEAMDILEDLQGFEADFNEIVADGDNGKAIAQQAVEVQQKLKKTTGKIKALEKSLEASGRKSEYVNKAKDKFVQLSRRVFEEGFGHEFNV